MIIVDAWTQLAKDLVYTLNRLGQKNVIISLEPDGFLPSDIENPFLYYLGNRQKAGKPLFFNQVIVPEFWEIQGDAHRGWIRQQNTTRANIVYLPDSPFRQVKAVEWLDNHGSVKSVDHYNKFGEIFAKTHYMEENQPFQTIYYDELGYERIIENHVTQDILLIVEEGMRVFHDRVAFYISFLKERQYDLSQILFNSLATSFFVSLGLENSGNDLLVWQEEINHELPGNMQFILDNRAIRCNKILVPVPETYHRIQQLVSSEYKNMFEPFEYMYEWTKENQYKKQALIVTNSDQIEQLQTLVERIPELTFHIAAPTEMSTTLMDYIRYKNVVLHQTVSQEQLNDLYQQCDIYLDINHYQEVPLSIRRAFLANQLILAYSHTIHQRQYVAREHIFEVENTNNMIELLKRCIENQIIFEEELIRQRKSAGVRDGK